MSILDLTGADINAPTFAVTSNDATVTMAHFLGFCKKPGCFEESAFFAEMLQAYLDNGNIPDVGKAMLMNAADDPACGGTLYHDMWLLPISAGDPWRILSPRELNATHIMGDIIDPDDGKVLSADEQIHRLNVGGIVG